MQQYLINATAIWFLSLLLFDVLLRRENYHAYNRFYLVLTLLAGALLPVVQWWNIDSSPVPLSLRDPLGRFAAVKQTLTITAPSANHINWEQWLTGVYALGVLITMCLLFADIIKLVRFHNAGKKTRIDGWRLVETGKEHAPFSFRRTLFVCSRDGYSNEEWQMILAHEQRHSNLLHIADLLLIHIARIAFWFHPLIYVYSKRLLLAHEYQADGVAAQQPQVYGKFLIEQAVLNAAPSISHSFNRSPIKNRIVMLTRNSSTTAKCKMLILLPLLLVAVACFSKGKKVSAKKFEKKGNTVTYNGNKFTLSDRQYDTMILIDPVDAKEVMQVRSKEPQPITMNGKKIYNDNEVTTKPQPIDRQATIEQNLVTNIALKLNHYPDGIYRVDLANIIIDDKGKVAYYEFGGISATDKAGKPIKIADDLTKKMENDISYLALAGTMKPATLNGKNVTMNSDIFLYGVKFEVNNHVTTYSY